MTIGLALGLGNPVRLRADAAAEAPDLKEVCDLIRAHLGGVSDSELNRAAVQALVTALSPRVTLITNATSGAPAAGVPLTRTTLFEGDIAYLRASAVGEGLPKSIQENFEKLSETNKLKGIVLDLRYAQGTDYAAAAAVADLFTKKERPLLNWGNGMVSSKEKSEAITLPVAILVNHQTAGGPEALAGMLRLLGAGLILGNRTAGQALIAQEFPLKNGDRLRIGTTPISLGDGSEFSPEGIKPDITVEVNAQDERAYYADAFRVIAKGSASAATNVSAGSGTNRPIRRPRFNESELIRERREGFNPDTDAASQGDSEPDKPLVHDPALARALDLLKGLAVVREAHS